MREKFCENLRLIFTQKQLRSLSIARRKQTGKTVTDKYAAYSFVMEHKSTYREWFKCEGLKIGSQNMRPKGKVEHIAVLYTMWEKLGLETPFPIPAEEMKIHPFVKEFQCKKIGEQRIFKLSQKCDKMSGKIGRLNDKIKIWNAKVNRWYQRYCTHKDFSDEHPEMQKFFVMKLNTKIKMDRLKRRLKHYETTLNNESRINSRKMPVEYTDDLGQRNLPTFELFG